MMSVNRRKVSYLKVAAGGIAACWRAHTPLFFALMIVSAMLCAIEVGELYALRGLFDAARAYMEGQISLRDVIASALPMAALLIATPLVLTLEYLGQGYFWRRGSGYLMARYHERIRRIPLIDFEKADTFDQMKKAQRGSEDTPSASRSIIQFAFHFIPYLILTSLFLISIKPVLVAALLIIFASVALAQWLRAGIVRRFEEENAGLRRQTEYLESCITGPEYAKETRTLGAVGFFFGAFMDSVKRFHKASMASERRIARIELLLRMVNVAGYAGILALLVYYVMEGSVSVGAFAAVLYSVERMSAVLKGIVDYFGEALTEMSTASFTYEFLNVPKAQGSAEPLDKRADIRLDHVCFSYPGSERDVLRDISLTIRQGETLAIVGENGAGKTTLTKLIMGLYRPTSGAVRYGAEDAADYVAASRFEGISGVFQSFIRYKLTAGENISISQADAPGGVVEAAERAGVRLGQLPDGVNTMLSREFGGTELSGGQWQRVAIARGLHRGHEVIVLDEPTAAIDPIEETNIFRLFSESARDKTAILVTHRLGSTKIADRILLMEDGRICELGTHEQLMARQGKYARMYREQASWYER